MTDAVASSQARMAFRPRLGIRSIFSFELFFALLCFVGTFKGAAFVQDVRGPYDLTVVLVAMSMLVGVVSLVTRPRAPLMRTKGAALFVGLYFLLILYATVSYLLGEGSEDATRKIQRVLVFDTWFLLGAMIGINTRERISRFLIFFVALGLFVAVTSLVMAPSDSHLGSFGTNNYHALGRYSGAALVVCAAYVAVERKLVSLYLLAAAVLGIGLVVSGTRHAILSATLSTLFIVWMVARPSGRFARVWPVLLLACVGVVLALGIKSLLFDDVSVEWTQARMLSTWESLQGDTISSNNRVVLWKAGWGIFTENPIFGVGFGGFRLVSVFHVYRHAHNMVFEYLSELGAVGFLLGTVLFAQPIRRSLQRASAVHREPLALAALFWFEFIGAQTSGDMAANRLVFTMGGLFIVSLGVFNSQDDDAALLPDDAPRLDAAAPTCGISGATQDEHDIN